MKIAATVLGIMALFLVIVMARIIVTTPTDIELTPAEQATYNQQKLDDCTAAKHVTKDCTARSFIDEVQHANQ